MPLVEAIGAPVRSVTARVAHGFASKPLEAYQLVEPACSLAALSSSHGETCTSSTLAFRPEGCSRGTPKIGFAPEAISSTRGKSESIVATKSSLGEDRGSLAALCALAAKRVLSSLGHGFPSPNVKAKGLLARAAKDRGVASIIGSYRGEGGFKSALVPSSLGEALRSTTKGSTVGGGSITSGGYLWLGTGTGGV